jgi:hypothetical protein
MELAGDQVAAFWSADEDYLVRTEGAAGVQWFRIETGEGATVAPVTEEERRRAGALMCDVIPLGGHRVAFPVGSSGRRVFRIWRGGRTASGSRRTTILGVRAARSRRLPA